jgi:phosphatidylserine synthase 2
MGTQTWVCVTVVFTEVLVCLKFDWETLTKPPPPHIVTCWQIFLSALVLWTVWQFYLWPFLTQKQEKKLKKAQ